jgi:small-conductance mechanosensitive channel
VTNEVVRAPDAAASLDEATGTLRELWSSVYGYLPKLAIVAGIFLLAVILGKLLTAAVKQLFSRWEKGVAAATLGRIALYLLALAIALSVLAGDAKALLGSVGLVGLALSWALQTPIESFTGWLLNSFRSYYRVGDRIEVGEVFGDVYKIDVLTTTVWEAGGPGKAVAGAQATGAMITFPNWEVLRSNIVNYSREFPYVWDEVTVTVANESDVVYAIKVFEGVARRLLAERMRGPTQEYQDLLHRARLAFDIPDEPKVFITAADAWINCTVRYLVGVRERRRWSTELLLALTREASAPQHRGKIVPAYPRTEVRLREDWEPQENGEDLGEGTSRG